ncbi:2-succinyl-5-enolpyruvyl-6-hydroxy-3-cyclohexene-1-carboxylic-acid synthase [Maribacter cobaltidurans]|uniref:2-succinyl-5-enolpyruvyl-6-hydroxy-3-cyclohexene-1-carboxylate synthase n=1 Tax=Maribacter cobaltidurans TaxID=1178778 RepID=A0A223V180_9FLAO|nr:2-succinyl-5-enolpyruvyl-6-hydroxy-3-cyclohexene-1-carboxylic-acid synthase [Maribacter cobaltidurans]ASV28818.1 2-succinyl-5-enolpyruvyl-6-hydroxy-3-cyclohexene-1-carboxylic-acid synthase [Maribacter cobaltidurans]GGD74564.1 2-succinyl-5-enolpyruvyl-6-hydroxy-3-cyclohexene-1-carboxylate synthase [Maribacter cobaltidurans]
MKYSIIPVVQSIIGHCQVNDIKNIVISPGSRNAPLTLSFTNDSFFKCFSIVDERSAAFFALGMAQNLKQPVVLVCTSGSALLNYYPAIAEAFYSEIPLIVISADRPSYKIDIGDGQTIRQENVYEKHIGYSANLRQDVVHATQRIQKYRPSWIEGKNLQDIQTDVKMFNETEIKKTLAIAFQHRLPVHINVPLEEPLYETEETQLELPEVVTVEDENPGNIPQVFLDAWNNSERKMVLVGVNPPNMFEQEILNKLGEDPSVLVFTETTSNLHHPNFFNSIDSILAPIELSKEGQELFLDLKPEILLTFGGHVVSKKIKAFLREYRPQHHWHIGMTKANDTYFCLSQHFKIPVNRFFESVYGHEQKKSSDYREKWIGIRNRYQMKRKKYLKEIPFCDFLVFDKVLKSVPENFQLHLANSSTIRYTQLFSLEQSLKVHCNRGTSGIDGSTSTAVGASVYNQSPTLLVTGDLSFFYDGNALWNDYVRNDFRIILINNGGGGIFRILPGRKDTEAYERFFETKHSLSASNLCKMFNFEYTIVKDENELQSTLMNFFEPSDFPRLLEIHTPRLINNKILTDYFHFIS